MVAPSDAVRTAATSAKSPSAAMIGLVMVLSSLTLVVLAPPASAVDFFYDGFEAGLGLWTVTGTGPPVEWHQANDTVDLCFGAPGHPAGAFAGNSTAAFHRDDVTPLTCTYATAGIVRGDLTLTTPVALPVTTPLRLRFASWHDTEADLFDDTLLAYVSNDSGLSWIVVSNIKGDGHPMQTWNDVQVGLDAYAGEAVQVRFSFDMFDNTANNFAGWHVDEVRLDDQPVMADTMTVLPTVLAPASVAAGTGDVAMLGLNLTAFPGTVNVVRVTVQLNGSPPDPADIPLIELWRDTGDGLFGLGDTLLASGTFGGGPPWEASLLTTPVAVGAGGITLFVTFDIAASAVDAHWVGAHLPDATYIGVTGGAVAPTGFPIDSYQPGIRTEILGLPGPPATITSPADQIWVNATTVSALGTATDLGAGIGRVEVSCNGGTSWNTATGTTAWNYTCAGATALAEGPNSVRARAFDSGNTEGPTHVITVNVDLTPPTVTIASPGNNAWVNATAVNFSGSAADLLGSGLDRVEVSCDDGGTWVPASGTSAWTRPCAALVAGANVVHARALDVVGWESAHEVITVNVDLIDPTVAITSHTEGQVVSGAAQDFSGTAADLGGSGINRTELSCDGGSTWVLAAGTSAWSAPCALVAGSNAIHARSWDDAGRSSAPHVLNVTLQAVGTAPVLGPTGQPNYALDGLHPESGGIGTPFDYRVNFSDAEDDAPTGGAPRVHVLQGGTPLPGSPFLMTAIDGGDTTYTDGKWYEHTAVLSAPGTNYSYFFTATDAAGNPAASWPSPPADAPDVMGFLPVTGIEVTVRDAGAPLAGALVILKRNNVTVDSRTTTSDGMELFANLSAGIYVVEVSKPGFEDVSLTVEVTAGQTATRTVSLVRLPAPVDYLLPVLLVLVAVIVMMILFLAWRRRKKPAEGETAPAPAPQGDETRPA